MEPVEATVPSDEVSRSDELQAKRKAALAKANLVKAERKAQAKAKETDLLERIGSVIEDLALNVSTLSKKVSALEEKQATSGPQFVPVGQTDIREVGPRQRQRSPQELAREEAERNGLLGASHKSLNMTSNGNEIPDMYMRVGPFKQRFKAGDAVRIRRDAPIDPDPEAGSETWGQVLDRLRQRPINCQTKECPGRIFVGDRCAECGLEPHVRFPMYFSRTGEWKYRVRVPGLTNARGDGFMDSQLEPA